MACLSIAGGFLARKVPPVQLNERDMESISALSFCLPVLSAEMGLFACQTAFGRIPGQYNFHGGPGSLSPTRFEIAPEVAMRRHFKIKHLTSGCS